LHANQRQEIEQVHRNGRHCNCPSGRGGKGIILWEILALHELQNQAIANADDFDEIVIPTLKEGYPGFTRSDLIELHKQQRLAIENEQDWDQIVIPDSEDGYPPLSWDVRGDLKLYFIWRFENVLLIVCIFFPKLYFLL
jgi:hypothetical protein